MKPFDRRILQAVPTTRRAVTVLGVIGAAQGVATIGTAFALAALVVAVVRGDPLPAPAAWTAGLFVLRALLSGIAEHLAARAGALVATSLREQLIDAWLQRPVDERPSRERALTLAAQGTSAVEPYIAKYLPTLIAAAVVPALAIGCLVVIDWPSALVVVLTVWLLPLFAALIGATTQEDTDRRWVALTELSGHFLDVMRGLPTLVAYGRAERQVSVIEQVSHRHRRATMRTLRLAFLSAAALELLATISVAIVAVLVGLRLTTGSMDLLVGLTAILLAPEAYWPIRRVGTEFHSAADGVAALEDILAELGEPLVPGHGEGPQSEPSSGYSPCLDTHDDGAVRVAGIRYTYPGATRRVLDAVDLVADGGLTVITGPSGVGKTTLLEVIAGTRRPDAGSVCAPAVHLVTQRPFLGAGTLQANLTLEGPQDPQRLWWALRETGLDGVIAALPTGLDSPLGDDGFGLSAGQRARLVLARALLSPAPVILLDEPTAHVDPDSAATIGDVITRLAVTRTVIAVSHQPDLIERADTRLELTAPAMVSR
ncbi:thiol reductant ABC exporter subunit CydD [Janibacter cremeus]|uniref:Thiol reductant ABC exporter CydD subunit n=1 Tax=Janibacter cremeus TaxID=1285192 RepID=A0A852VXY0_9MICO|nr:thiol reductant ABC exporter subunit CydD [Janibacter cremeus]NYF98615.1 thiol reductant ABC exporter CydD subunit [Janibacter cremeus]